VPAVRSPRFATQRQMRLFDDLVDLFTAEGFAVLTLDGISARLRCSKSTLYSLADSKEQLVTAVVIHFFRRATDAVEQDVAKVVGARERVTAYLLAVGDALGAASDRFMADLDAFAPARDIYEKNTRIAANRVRELIAEGVAAGEFRDVHAAFAGELAATMMAGIQQRRVRETTGLDDAEAYRELAALLTGGISA
jgi:AcrR family transcriptional regulator